MNGKRMKAMNIEVRVAAISFENRLIRYLKEFQIDRRSSGSEVFCSFFMPHSLPLAFFIRCKGFDGVVKKFWFTLQSTNGALTTGDFVISEANHKTGHVIAPNASQTGLPSTDIDHKLFRGLENEDAIIVTVLERQDGPALATFTFKAMKSTGKEGTIFTSDSSICFASRTNAVKRKKAVYDGDIPQQPRKKTKKDKGKKKGANDTHGKVKQLKGRSQSLPVPGARTIKLPPISSATSPLNLSKVVAAPVKHEKEKDQTISKKSIDRGTPPELIMQQEQRETIREIEEKIEHTTNEYEKEKNKIEVKMGKLEKGRHEKKKEFEHKLHDLQRAKTAAQEKLDWIIANTAPIELGESTSDDGKEKARQRTASVIISDSESESDSTEESYRSTSSTPLMKVRSTRQ